MKCRNTMLACAAAGFVGLAACQSTPEAPPERVFYDENGAPISVAEAGKQAYLTHCAGCHETGLEGAPVVGDREYWETRSRLWQAVLSDHAKAGYLDMPAKGGRPDLPDEKIDLAVDYMLSVTYPELPPDQPELPADR